LNQASRVCVVFLEERGRSVMMACGLIGMIHCGALVSQTCMGCGHVFLQAYDASLRIVGETVFLARRTPTTAGSETTQARDPNPS
jgi:hypothetical protein